jgi:hypothetical protein
MTLCTVRLPRVPSQRVRRTLARLHGTMTMAIAATAGAGAGSGTTTVRDADRWRASGTGRPYELVTDRDRRAATISGKVRGLHCCAWFPRGDCAHAAVLLAQFGVDDNDDAVPDGNTPFVLPDQRKRGRADIAPAKCLFDTNGKWTFASVVAKVRCCRGCIVWCDAPRSHARVHPRRGCAGPNVLFVRVGAE